MWTNRAPRLLALIAIPLSAIGQPPTETASQQPKFATGRPSLQTGNLSSLELKVVKPASLVDTQLVVGPDECFDVIGNPAGTIESSQTSETTVSWKVKLKCTGGVIEIRPESSRTNLQPLRYKWLFVESALAKSQAELQSPGSVFMQFEGSKTSQGEPIIWHDQPQSLQVDANFGQSPPQTAIQLAGDPRGCIDFGDDHKSTLLRLFPDNNRIRNIGLNIGSAYHDQNSDCFLSAEIRYQAYEGEGGWQEQPINGVSPWRIKLIRRPSELILFLVFVLPALAAGLLFARRRARAINRWGTVMISVVYIVFGVITWWLVMTGDSVPLIEPYLRGTSLFALAVGVFVVFGNALLEELVLFVVGLCFKQPLAGNEPI